MEHTDDKPKRAIGPIDYFVYDQFSKDPDMLHLARVLVGCWLTFGALLAVAVFYFLFLSPLNLISIVMGAGLCSLVWFMFLYLLIRIKKVGDYLVCANITLGVLFSSLLIGVAVSAGPLTSPVTSFIYLPAVMAYLLLGRLYGTLWMVGAMVVLAGLVFLETTGFQFPQSIDVKHETETRIIVFWIELMAVLGLISIYDFTNRQLRRERDDEHERWVFLANHDQLTTLANRVRFDNVLQKTLQWHERRKPGPVVALVYLDLDGFKPINDSYGHHVGDQVLQTVASRLKEALRDTDLISRHGGDEFVMMLDRLQDEKVVGPIIDKLLSRIAEPIETSVDLVSVTGSIGVALYPAHTKDTEKLKVYADKAMYQAKERGVGWVMHQPKKEEGSPLSLAYTKKT